MTIAQRRTLVTEALAGDGLPAPWESSPKCPTLTAVRAALSRVARIRARAVGVFSLRIAAVMVG